MAIRNIANQEKHRKEKKSRTHKGSSDKVSNTAVKESQAAKMESDAQDTTTFTEVFDSSKYDSMAEMKKSADMQEEPAITDVQTSNVNVNSSHITTTVADTSLPNLEEKAAELRGSKPEQTIDNTPTDCREKLQEDMGEVKDKREEAETWPTHGLASPYTLFSDAAKSWTELHVESARSVAEITRYWLDLFCSPDLKKAG
jgi:hypothetical protein